MVFLFDFFKKRPHVYLWALWIGALCCWVIPFVKMGYIDDDFGDVFRSLSLRLSDWYAVFSAQLTVNHSMQLDPSLTSLESNNVLLFYRPLWIMWGYFQALCGLAGPYASLWVSTLLHSLVVTLLWHNLWAYLGFAGASFITGLYAFHPALGFWLGRFSMIQYCLNALLLAAIVMLVRTYLERTKKRFLVAAVVLFCASLLIRETLILLPFWLTLAVWWYIKYCMPQAAQSHKVFRSSLVATLPFYAASFVYLVVRSLLLSIPVSQTRFLHSFFDVWLFIKAMFYQHLSFIVDALWVSVFPPGTWILKLLMLSFVAGMMLRLFIVSPYKASVLVWFAGFMILSRPSLLLGHSQPYMYESYVLFCVMLAWLTAPVWNRIAETQLEKKLWLVLCALVIAGSVRCHLQMRRRYHTTSTIHNALVELLNNPYLQNKTLCFIGVPYAYFPVTGIWAACKLLQGRFEVARVVHDGFFTYWEQSFMRQDGFVEPGTNPKIVRSGRRIVVSYPENHQSWFLAASDQNEVCIPGGVIHILERSGQRGYKLEWVFDKTIKKSQLVCVTWDAAHGKFKVVM